ILEAGNRPGGFFQRFPRHRRLISINKLYTGYDDVEINLRWDWNSLLSDDEQLLFKHYSKDYFPTADDLAHYLSEYAERYALRIKYGAAVVRVEKDGFFKVHDRAGNTYMARRLIVAAGVTKPYHPPVPGIELAECYTEVSINPAEFINQRVLIIG